MCIHNSAHSKLVSSSSVGYKHHHHDQHQQQQKRWCWSGRGRWVSEVLLSSISCLSSTGLSGWSTLLHWLIAPLLPSDPDGRRSRRSYRTSSAPIHVGRRRILGSIIHPRVSYRTEPHPAHGSVCRSVARSVGPRRPAAFDAVIDFSLWRRRAGAAWSERGRRRRSPAGSSVRVVGQFNTC